MSTCPSLHWGKKVDLWPRGLGRMLFDWSDQHPTDQMIVTRWSSTGKRNTTTRDWCPFHMSWIKWIQSRWSSTVTGKGPLYTSQYTTTQCHHMIWIEWLYPAARSVMTMIKQIQIQCTTSSISTNRTQSIMRMCILLLLIGICSVPSAQCPVLSAQCPLAESAVWPVPKGFVGPFVASLPCL